MMNTILQILADNARLTNEQLAAMTGKTTVEVAQEIDRLQREGIIKGYKAIVDWDKTDRSLCLARIELKVTPKSGMGFDEIAGTIAQFDEVQEVYLMSGGYDLAVTIKGTNLRDVAMFVTDRLAPLGGVLSTTTHFILHRYKEKDKMFLKNTDERSLVSP